MKTTSKTRTAPRNVDYYLSLPYRVEIIPISTDEGGGYNACIPRLGRWTAVGDGDTPEEAYADLRAALPSLIEDWIRRGISVPEPDAEAQGASGKLSLRLPKTLHAQAAQAAAQEGVSINQFITVTLAQAIGAKIGTHNKTV